MLYFNGTRLNEAYFAYVSFAKSAKTFICYAEFFSLKIPSDFGFLISQGTISHMLSVPKYTVQFLCL